MPLSTSGFPIAVVAAKALLTMPDIPAWVLPALEEIVRRTSDVELLFLLAALANNGTAEGKRITLNLALSSGAPFVSEAACEVIAAAPMKSELSRGGSSRAWELNRAAQIFHNGAYTAHH